MSARSIGFFSISYMALFTSKSECYPLSILESIANKKPVVATNVESINDIQDVMVSDDIRLLVKEVELLLSNNNYYSNKIKEISETNKLLSRSSVMKKYDHFILD